jgi:PST family polysaccharide transporter/lipopolysaccharide exporter
LSPALTREAGSALKWRTVQQVGVKGVYLIRIPILARLLSPDDFGLLAIALVAVDVLLRLTDMGMIPALVQREEVQERHYDVAWTVGVTRSLLVAAGLFAAAPVVAALFEEPRAIPIIRALAIRPLLDAFASMKVANLTRYLRFRGLAVLHLAAAVVNAGTSIALAPFVGVWALVAGALAGPCVYGVLSYVLAPYRPRLRLDLTAASSLIRFGRWIFVIGLIGLVSRFVLQAVISRRLGTVELGLYYLAARIAYLPTEVSAELVGSVAFPLYARIQSDVEKARRAFRVLFTGMIGLLVPVTALLFVLAPSLVHDLLGPRWAGTEAAIQVLALVTVIELFGDALTPIFKGMGRPSAVALLVGIQTAILIGLVWDLAGRFGLAGAVAAWLPATAAAQIVGFFLLRRMIPRAYAGLGRPVAGILLISVCGAFAAHLVDAAVPGLVGLFLASALGAAVVGFLFLEAERRVGLGIGESLAQIQPRVAHALARLGIPQNRPDRQVDDF